MGALLGIFTSVAGGGFLGSLTGLFKNFMDSRERTKLAQLELERDRLDMEAAALEHTRALELIAKGAEIDLAKTRTEGEAAIEVATAESRGAAVISEFKNLKTSSFMDNLRASVRPVFAYLAVSTFGYMLVNAWLAYGHLLTQEQGLALLLVLIDTLIFMVTSIVSFYYVSRRNPAPSI